MRLTRFAPNRVIVATNFLILDRGLYLARLHPEREHLVAIRVQPPAPRGMYLSSEQLSHSIRCRRILDGDLLVVAGRATTPARPIASGAFGTSKEADQRSLT
jgi:hypothetical protein